MCASTFGAQGIPIKRLQRVFFRIIKELSIVGRYILLFCTLNVIELSFSWAGERKQIDRRQLCVT